LCSIIIDGCCSSIGIRRNGSGFCILLLFSGEGVCPTKILTSPKQEVRCMKRLFGGLVGNSFRHLVYGLLDGLEFGLYSILQSLGIFVATCPFLRFR
jgi:hypothetical protein